MDSLLALQSAKCSANRSARGAHWRRRHWWTVVITLEFARPYSTFPGSSAPPDEVAATVRLGCEAPPARGLLSFEQVSVGIAIGPNGFRHRTIGLDQEITGVVP